MVGELLVVGLPHRIARELVLVVATNQFEEGVATFVLGHLDAVVHEAEADTAFGQRLHGS